MTKWMIAGLGMIAGGAVGKRHRSRLARISSIDFLDFLRGHVPLARLQRGPTARSPWARAASSSPCGWTGRQKNRVDRSRTILQGVIMFCGLFGTDPGAMDRHPGGRRRLLRLQRLGHSGTSGSATSNPPPKKSLWMQNLHFLFPFSAQPRIFFLGRKRGSKNTMMKIR